jgi:hypothetical protein
MKIPKTIKNIYKNPKIIFTIISTIFSTTVENAQK